MPSKSFLAGRRSNHRSGKHLGATASEHAAALDQLTAWRVSIPSDAALARILDVTPSYIYMIRSGKRCPDGGVWGRWREKIEECNRARLTP